MQCGSNTILGWIVGESTPLRSLIIFSRNALQKPRAGSYVVAEGPEGCMLGIVEAVSTGHRMLPSNVTDPEAVDTIVDWAIAQGADEDLYARGAVRWLSLLDPLVNMGKVVSPKTPAPPGTRVYPAPPSVLSQVFASGKKGWIRLGKLPDSNVPFHIDVNSLTRHLAILAVTGGGKSNTVCILARRIVEGLGGTMVIFDMHGEYKGILEDKGLEVNHSPARINPATMTFHELASLMRIPDNAHNQRRFLRWAWKATRHLYNSQRITAGEMLETVHYLLENLREIGRLMEQAKKNKSLAGNTNPLVDALIKAGLRPPRVTSEESLAGILNRVEDFMEFYSDVLDPTVPLSLTQVIPPNKLTIFDLSIVDEQSADAIVSHYMRRILQARKTHKSRGSGESYPVPVVLVVEEAHVLVPRDDSTLTKYWAGRIAREGRKFGVGLTLVSQRPKNIDADVLSQTNNKIILRMVEPEDIKYVQRASEELSDDIASLLPGLNPGEAVVTGKMAVLPGLVRIDLCEGKKKGADIDMVAEWESYREGGGDIDVDDFF